MTISRNYPVKPFSPETHLAAGIDAVATTIVLNDASMLPLPPNLAVIEDGDNSEVVLYTTQDANSIGGCTRAFIVDGTRGIAKTHAANTPVARYISSYDLNTLMANESYLFSQQAIGVQWDRGAADTTALTLIDVDGNPIETLPFASFDNHRTFREIRRCILSTTGTPTFGENARGDGLTLDGSAGRVMVAIPKFWVKADNPSTGVYRWWISPIDLSGFEVHPAFRQRGGIDREYIYVSAYQANLLTRDYPAHASATLALHSRTGEQPVTGAAVMATMAFTSGGTTAPVVGETVTGATSGATATIVDWYVTSGTWAGGDAAGTLILKQVSGTFGSENLNGSSAGSNFATGAAVAGLNLPITAARTYAENIGTGWGLINIYSWAAIVLLQMIEYGNFNMQATLGRGVCDLAKGTGFSGRVNGYGSADSTIGTNGSGMALGTNGQTPVVWRGIENLYGNVETFVDGVTSDSSSRKVSLIPRSGAAAITTPTATVETSIGQIPASFGAYATDLLFEPLTRLLFIPKTLGGAAGTFLCDKYLGPNPGSGAVLCNGGPLGWFGGDTCGPFAFNMFYDYTNDNKQIGARLEYIGPEGTSPTTASVTPGGGGDVITVPAATRVTTPSIVPDGVSPTTPPPPATNPSTPNTDPPIYVVPAQTVQDGSLLGGSFGYGYNPAESGVVIKWDAGALNTNATTCLMTGQTTAKAGKSFTYSFGYQLFRTPTGYGSTGFVSAGIPQGATVTGFTVKRYGSYTGAAPATGRDLKLFLRFTDPDTPGGWIDSNDYAKTTTDWQYHSDASHGIYLTSYGGETDLWGLTAGQITPTILNNGGVQVVLQVESLANGGTAGDFRLYALQVEISYEV